MRRIVAAVTELVYAVHRLVEQQDRNAAALSEVAREQRITNLIVRSQITVEPEATKRLMDEAARRMDPPRRAARPAHSARLAAATSPRPRAAGIHRKA